MDASSTGHAPTLNEIGPPSDAESWLDLIDYLASEMAEREEAIECDLDDIEIAVPMAMSPEAETAEWRFNGAVRVRFGEVQVPLKAWLQYWEQSE